MEHLNKSNLSFAYVMFALPFLLLLVIMMSYSSFENENNQQPEQHVHHHLHEEVHSDVNRNHADENHEHHHPPNWTGIMFIGMLLSIAILPVWTKTEKLWHHWWFQMAISVSWATPSLVWMVWNSYHGLGHVAIEYFQFITLLGTLYTISGNIHIAGDIRATPKNNSIILAIGTLIASFIGTTGAAMLLIRPLIRVNQQRKMKVHTVVFFIFLVANCGGLLTPLGDPPLFMGFLRGVPFGWTFSLWPFWLATNSLLLFTFYGLDRQAYAHEEDEDIERDDTERKPLGILGGHNLLTLTGVIMSVAFLPTPWREISLIVLTLLSFKFTKPEVRNLNEFNWGPMIEVAILFIGIFATMSPALGILRALAPSIPMDSLAYFFLTGGLSGFLDNAPCYVTFFELAQANSHEGILVAGVYEPWLVKISLGAVFFGALTYIGNGPNLMVKSIANMSGIPMPEFGEYFLDWGLRYIVPINTSVVMVFSGETLGVQTAGVVVLGTSVIPTLVSIFRYPDEHPHTRLRSEGKERKV